MKRNNFLSFSLIPVDPETGRIIGKREKQIGEIVVTSYQNKRISEATISSGMGFQAGYVVRGIK